jgi:hypothetical protein
MRVPRLTALIASLLALLGCNPGTNRENALAPDRYYLKDQTPEEVYRELTRPDTLHSLLEQAKQEPYRSIFLDAKGHLRADRIPRLELFRARTLVDYSEQAALRHLRAAGLEASRMEVLSLQSGYGDQYVGLLEVPGLGLLGEVWTPATALAHATWPHRLDSYSHFSWLIPYKELRPTLAGGLTLQDLRGQELYWARLELERFNLLRAERDASGKVSRLTDVASGQRYAVAYTDPTGSGRPHKKWFSTGPGEFDLVLEGRPIYLIEEGAAHE